MEDSYGNTVENSVEVSVVQDSIPPSIFAVIPVLEYESGTTRHTISWIIDDLNPLSYSVFRNDDLWCINSWTHLSNITLSVDNLPVGDYNYTLLLQDISGNQNSSTIIVRVKDTTNPQILMNPLDQIIEEGSIIFLNWTISDLNPVNYTVYLDSILYEAGAWKSTEKISIIFSDLSVGDHTVSIYVSDIAQNVIIDQVNIMVNPAPTTTGSTTTDTSSTDTSSTDTSSTDTSSSSQDSTSTSTTTGTTTSAQKSDNEGKAGIPGDSIRSLFFITSGSLLGVFLLTFKKYRTSS